MGNAKETRISTVARITAAVAACLLMVPYLSAGDRPILNFLLPFGRQPIDAAFSLQASYADEKESKDSAMLFSFDKNIITTGC